LHLAQASCEGFVEKWLQEMRDKHGMDWVIDDSLAHTYPTEQQKDGSYRVEFILDAYSGFDEMLNLRVDCRVRHADSGNWQLLSLEYKN
jgi:hypothetical protein